MNEHPNYYAIIPANVRYDKQLPPTARLLYGEITALCNKEGYCWASNRYFADLYDIDTSTVSKLIKALETNGYITTEIVYKTGTKQIDQRRIRLTSAAPVLNKAEETDPPPPAASPDTPLPAATNTGSHPAPIASKGIEKTPGGIENKSGGIEKTSGGIENKSRGIEKYAGRY
jgi:SOS-response transcriptional repressor LexA